MSDQPLIQTVELGEATLERLEKILMKAADHIADNMPIHEPSAHLDAVSVLAEDQLVDIIKRALKEHERNAVGPPAS